MPKKGGSCGGGSRGNQSNNNRSNQSNPNNPAFYQSRGISTTRPDNWSTTAQQHKQNGQMEYDANRAGMMSNQQRRAMGSDTRRVEKVTKAVLGGSAQVYHGGSQKKHTNVQTSDLDLKIRVDRPLTQQDRQQLGQGLVKEFGKTHVDSRNPKIHQVRGQFGQIDVVPSKADYFPPEFKLDKPGTRPFATNNVGQQAVRLLKLNHGNPGIHIERTVLSIQQQNRGIGLHELVERSGEAL